MRENSVQNREDLLERLRLQKHELRHYGVNRLLLFGSFARSEPRPESDVDLIVEFLEGRKTYDAFITLVDFLESTLGRRVELVTAEALSPYLGPRIAAEAQDVLRAA